MLKAMRVPLMDIIFCLSSVVDMICPEVKNHQLNVAYISLSIADQLGLDDKEKRTIVVAASLHDIGILSLEAKQNMLEYDAIDKDCHSIRGALMLDEFNLFGDISTLIRHHHTDWADFKNMPYSYKTKLFSNIIYLADRVDILLGGTLGAVNGYKEIISKIIEDKGEKYDPQIVDAFVEVSNRTSFWLDLEENYYKQILINRMNTETIKLDIDEMMEISLFISQLIDFRSRFTATHSSGVAAVADSLCHLIGFTERECKMLKIAGYLHDLGKLIVPNEILEKPAKLNAEELHIMRKHTYYTFRALENIENLYEIAVWASSHHERLNGGGYPFMLKKDDMSYMSRILAVSDVITALTEDRPYRKGMCCDDALSIINEMTEQKDLDIKIVDLLKLNYSSINNIRKRAQEEAFTKYEHLTKNLLQY